MNHVEQTLGALSIGAPFSHANLSCFPLVSRTGGDPDYLVLDEVLAAGLAHVTEVSESGQVPELRFENAAARPVLLLDGEELVGARQNRVLNITLLVAAGAKLVIPVSCVEQGRWSWRSREFQSSRRAMFARGRAQKMAQVSHNLRVANARYADQSAVWESVAQKSEHFAADAPTGAMSDVYQGLEARLAGFRDALQPRPGQVGGVFCIDGQVAGLELFDAATTWEKLGAKLAESYAVDALESAHASTVAPEPRAVAEFLARMQCAPVERFAALGLGEDLRLEGEGVVGGGLYAEGRLIQLSAFDTATDPGGARRRAGSRVVSLAERRRHHGPR